MTQEEKEPLLKDLCARLPYLVRCTYPNDIGLHIPITEINIHDGGLVGIHGKVYNLYGIKPYLRPMSSMTEDEIKEFRAFHCVDGWHPEFYQVMCNLPNINNMVNWLDKKMFDHRGLIPMDLALEAPENMYKNGNTGTDGEI